MGNKFISSSLKHYGVKGQKWGVINKDDLLGAGSKTPRLSPNVLKLDPKLDNFSVLKTQLTKEIQDDAKNRITNFDLVPRFDARNEAIQTALTKINEGYAFSPLMDEATATKYDLYSPWDGMLTFSNNCPSASFAYELRRRGLDVEAGLTGGATIEEIGSAFNMSEEEMTEAEESGIPPKTFEELEQSLKEMGPGARGFCIMYWNMGGGHICSFEVNKKGEVIFIDAQTGRSSQDGRSKGDDNPAEYYKNAGTYFAVRVDNRKMNTEVLKNWTRVDDKKQPAGTPKITYMDPANVKKAKDFITHNSDMSLTDLP